MVWPVLVLAAPLLKLVHVNGWAVYYGVKSYGFPRVYRRLMEANKRLVADPKARSEIRGALQTAFRMPSTAYTQLVSNSSVFSFLRVAVADLKGSSSAAALAMSVFESRLGSTYVGKLFKELEEAARKDAARRKP